MCRFSKLLLFSFFFCKDGSDRLINRASYSCCACCYLLEASPVSLVVLAIRLFLFFFHCDTHTHMHTPARWEGLRHMHEPTTE